MPIQISYIKATDTSCWHDNLLLISTLQYNHTLTGFNEYLLKIN